MLHINVDDFITLLSGVKVIVTADNIGTPQCVDVIQLYAQILGAPRFTGDAQDIYDQPGDCFIQIANTPDNFPLKGDIVVLNSLYNGTVGHVGMSTDKSNVLTCELFEQNDPLGSDCHTNIYTYRNEAGNDIVRGWLRPKQLPQAISAVTMNAESVSVPKTQLDYVINFFTKLRGGN